MFRRQKVRKWRDISVFGNPRCLKKSNLDKIVHWVKLFLNFLKFFTMGTTQMLCHGGNTSQKPKASVLFLQLACLRGAEGNLM